MRAHDLDRFSGGAVHRLRILIEQHEVQRALTKEMAIDVELGQRVAELLDNGSGALVDEHLVRLRFWCYVVHERDALVEEVPSPHLNVTTHPVCRNSSPFRAREELTGNR